MEDSMNFHDKVVLVAGGTGGLGRESYHGLSRSRRGRGGYLPRAEEFAALVSSAERIRATPPEGAAVDVTTQRRSSNSLRALWPSTGALTFSSTRSADTPVE